MNESDREQLRLWLEETESDGESVLGIEDPDEAEEDNIETNIQRSDEDNEGSDLEHEFSGDDGVRNYLLAEDMEQEDGGVVEAGLLDNCEFYIGKYRETRWYVEPHMARTSRTQSHNIIPHFTGLVLQVEQKKRKHPYSPLNAFSIKKL
ncbi:hypothetical protein J6590_031269 [Homalodisca vitripennis]|nr:hypothetical protein J6590_031269 [Homalodisca vitripennis]